MADARANEKSLPQLASELWQLVVTYVKQETLEPMKGLARFVGFGMAGAFALGIGFVLVILGVLRILQTETGDLFDDGWGTLGPYAIGLVVAGAIAALAASRIGAAKKKTDERKGQA